MAEIKFEYHSVKDVLPADDGKHYDVMVILWNDSIEAGYGYYKGTYNDGFFFVDNAIYARQRDFRCSYTQKKVIAWKPLETVSKEQLNEFCIKAGVR